ncbi:hypothetical protein EH223_06070 [candidate division KSB1 bacterium]|nr:class 1 isoprenoid biosynthesis enzyme [candidate division KSB1 bacterium]RQW05005.1 MAG: hypothetical protein EH223_06070 [candidate division KSB1 bacterium]
MAHPFFMPVKLFEETSLYADVEALVDDFAEIWTRCRSNRPPLKRTFSPREQIVRETHLEAFLKKLQHEQRNKNARFDDGELQNRLFAHVRTFFGSALGFTPEQLDLILSLGFKESTKDFVQLAHKFDSLLQPADIFQACRNVWIMNGLQLLLGRAVKLTPSIFAYSMLYPYTDNYLDDASISREEKSAFNNRFARRLAGRNVSAYNTHERSIFSLVEMIESDFERSRWPKVFESLLAIHQAQTKSVQLLGTERVADEDILRISLEKGGTSVLADGYLVAGNLTHEQARFMFGYGAYLQFLDDLQDVHEDSQTGQRSLYTLEAKRNKLDAITNKTFHFGDNVLTNQSGFYGSGVRVYTGLMRSSIQLMLLEAAGFAPQLFSTTYLKKIEKHSPFRFLQLRKLKQTHTPYYASMFGKLI